MTSGIGMDTQSVEGFARDEARPQTWWEPNLYGYRIARMMVEWLTAKSVVPQNELEKWLADLEEQASRDEYFYSINGNICLCVK